MMYKSPIQANYAEPIYEQIRDAFDNEVFKAVQAVNIEVDKDELIKALKYDRGQYEKGYWDGRAYKSPAYTNADRIRAMTDEELAEFLLWVEWNTAKPYWSDWLKQEIDE